MQTVADVSYETPTDDSVSFFLLYLHCLHHFASLILLLLPPLLLPSPPTLTHSNFRVSTSPFLTRSPLSLSLSLLSFHFSIESLAFFLPRSHSILYSCAFKSLSLSHTHTQSIERRDKSDDWLLFYCCHDSTQRNQWKYIYKSGDWQLVASFATYDRPIFHSLICLSFYVYPTVISTPAKCLANFPLLSLFSLLFILFLLLTYLSLFLPLQGLFYS